MKKWKGLLALALVPAVAFGAPAEDRTAPQGSVAKYCSSTANSSGQMGIVEIVGNLCVSTNTTWLMSTQCPSSTWGVFLMGATPTRLPFGDGFLCISPFETPIYRLGLPGMSDPMGISMKHLDFNAYPLPGMTVQPGSTWYFQCFFRDHAAGGAGFNLSNALAATFVQ